MDRLKSEKTTQTAILAMETLNKAIEVDKGYEEKFLRNHLTEIFRSNTIMELVDRLKKVRNMIDELEDIPQKISIKSGTELFLRFTTLRVQNILHSESDIGKIKKELGTVFQFI